MTHKYVKELIESLQRFNPEARLEHEVEVSSHSPATLCKVSVPSIDEKLENAILNRISNSESDEA